MNSDTLDRILDPLLHLQYELRCAVTEPDAETLPPDPSTIRILSTSHPKARRVYASLRYGPFRPPKIVADLLLAPDGPPQKRGGGFVGRRPYATSLYYCASYVTTGLQGCFQWCLLTAIESQNVEKSPVRSVTTSYTFQREFSRCTGGEPPFSFRSVDLRGAGTNMEPWKTQLVRRRNMTIVSRISFVRQKTSLVPFGAGSLDQQHAAG